MQKGDRNEISLYLINTQVAFVRTQERPVKLKTRHEHDGELLAALHIRLEKDTIQH
jgi:hypothetical protein